MSRFLLLILLIPVLGTMSSCLGVNADIAINSNNSGTLTLEYRISGLLDSLGRLDGNEGYPPLPVGRTDMERTADRIPGIRLLSHRSRSSGRDTVVTAKLEFSEIEALLLFFDAAGQKAVFASDGNSQKITFTLTNGNNDNRNQNQDLASLIRQVSAGYRVSITMNLPSAGQVAFLDNEGTLSRTGFNGMELVPSGRRVSCSLPLESIFFADNGIKAEFAW